MATPRNKRKLAALNTENCEEGPRSHLEKNSNAPRSQEDFITRILRRAESCILGALSRLDDFLLNPLIQGHNGTAPGTCRNTVLTNQGTNEDNSYNDLHPEAGVCQSQMQTLAQMTLATLTSCPVKPAGLVFNSVFF